MPKVTYREPSGEVRIVDTDPGTSLMETALDNDIDGIVGECGGNAMCATCHVYVDEEYLPHLPAMAAAEDAMLDSALAQRCPNSRLGCQIPVTDALDGLTVTVPEGL